MDYLNVGTYDGKIMSALYAPARVEQPKQAPGIVLIQEIFGINDAMQKLATIWSEKGFNVLCPDLFFRQQPGLTLDPHKPEEFEKGVQLMQGMELDPTLSDLESTRAHLATLLGHQNIGAMGYCLGGRLVIQMGAQNKIKAAVSYYGVGLEKVLPQVPAAAAPALLHLAELDNYTPEPVIEAIAKNVDSRNGWAYYTYPDCDHAFARPDGAQYNAEAATLAQTRSHEFLNALLG